VLKRLAFCFCFCYIDDAAIWQRLFLEVIVAITKPVSVELSVVEVNLLSDAINVKVASLNRSINTIGDAELKSIYMRKRDEYFALRSRIGGVL
jgi:hypothetical protein